MQRPPGVRRVQRLCGAGWGKASSGGGTRVASLGVAASAAHSRPGVAELKTGREFLGAAKLRFFFFVPNFSFSCL